MPDDALLDRAAAAVLEERENPLRGLDNRPTLGIRA